MMRVRFVGLSVLLCVSACGAQEVAIRGGNGVKLGAPPVVAVKPVTDTVGGRQVTDNYRWLEDQKAPDTRAYIDAQMAYTASYFAQIEPLKAAMVKRLTELQRVDVIGVPTERHGKFFFSKRLAAENQASIYMREGLHGADVRLIDASTLSADGNASVGIADLSSDGKLLMYSERHGGADEEMVRAFDVATRKELGDALPLARYSGLSLYTSPSPRDRQKSRMPSSA